eukprot:s171_g33.t3
MLATEKECPPSAPFRIFTASDMAGGFLVLAGILCNEFWTSPEAEAETSEVELADIVLTLVNKEETAVLKQDLPKRAVGESHEDSTVKSKPPPSMAHRSAWPLRAKSRREPSQGAGGPRGRRGAAVAARRRLGRRVQAAATLTFQDDGWDDDPDTNEEVPLSKKAPLLIDGRIVVPQRSFRVTSPATGDLVGVAPNASKEMIEAAVVAAARAAPGWAALRHAERAAMLQSCADALRANLEALATLQTNESGRPLAETRLEVIVAAASFENAARFLDVSQERLISEDEEKKVVIRRMPVGVVAVIAPWNAPIVLGWKPTATALACGNPVVLKPAPQTPLTTLRIGELLRSLLPRGVLNVVVGSDLNTPRPGEILTSHDLVRKVVFTGSTAIGSKVMEACAKGFKRLLLELGGNDPAIVREDCDVEKAAEGLFKGAFFNNGQTCCAAKRIYVQEKIYDKFVKAFVARARSAVLGNGLSSGTELGPLASAVQLRHVMELLQDARRKGGRVLCGGGATAGPPGDEGSNTGLFYLPTIVVDVAEGTRLVDEEQFGPVVPVMSYKDDEEAVQRANATRYGLSASIWSQDFDKANEIANRLKAGTVWVNKHCEFIRNAPFGGIDESGIGRAGDLGEQDLNQYTEIRTLCLAKAPPKLPPDVESLQHTPEVVVEERARSALQRLFRRVRSQDELESAAQEALRVFPFQPCNLRSALTSLSCPTGSACVLLRGLPVETPIARRRLESQASLLGVLGLLGASAYALGDEEPQGFVRDVDEASEASTWHRDGRSAPSFDAPRRLFRPEKSVPDFALSMCVGEGVKGSFVDFRRLRAVADPQDVALLQKEPIAFFDSKLGLRSERVLVAASQEEDFDATRKRRVFTEALSPELLPLQDVMVSGSNYAECVMPVQCCSSIQSDRNWDASVDKGFFRMHLAFRPK